MLFNKLRDMLRRSTRPSRMLIVSMLLIMLLSKGSRLLTPIFRSVLLRDLLLRGLAFFGLGLRLRRPHRHRNLGTPLTRRLHLDQPCRRRLVLLCLFGRRLLVSLLHGSCSLGYSLGPCSGLGEVPTPAANGRRRRRRLSARNGAVGEHSPID